jgi:hypothetical protein
LKMSRGSGRLPPPVWVGRVSLSSRSGQRNSARFRPGRVISATRPFRAVRLPTGFLREAPSGIAGCGSRTPELPSPMDCVAQATQHD